VTGDGLGGGKSTVWYIRFYGTGPRQRKDQWGDVLERRETFGLVGSQGERKKSGDSLGGKCSSPGTGKQVQDGGHRVLILFKGGEYCEGSTPSYRGERLGTSNIIPGD